MIEGSCLCGGVKFEIDEREILLINNCHCSYCRKVTGAAYATTVQIPRDHFRWLAGNELVATYESSPGNHRAFCKVCGSRAPQSANSAEVVGVPAGCLDGDPGVRPTLNMFTASKAPWHTIEDESMMSLPGTLPEGLWRMIVAAKENRGGA